MVYAVLLNDARNLDEVNASENSELERQIQDDQGDDASTTRTAKTPEYSVEHKWLLFFSSIYIFTFAGAMWGFGPLQLLLEEHGAFHSLCPSDYDGDYEYNPDNPHNVCPEQAARLVTAQMTGQLMLLSSPILGAIADKYSTKVLMNIIALAAILGLSILAIAIATHVDELLFLAFICLGLMAVGSTIMTVQTGMVFEGRMRTRVISGLNALFDAGSITYLGLYYAKQRLNISFTAIVGAYLAIAIVTFGGAAYFWSVLHTDIDAEIDGDEDLQVERDVSAAAQKHDKATDEEDLIEETNANVIIVGEGRQQLCSKTFITLVIYFSFYMSRNIFALTTARNFLGYLGDDDMNNRYLTIFTLLMPASLVALPLVDIVLDKFGFHAGLQSVNILALLHGLIQVCSKDLNVQIFGFVAFTFFRCFLFSVSFSFMASFLSPKNSGIGAGYMNLAGGVCILVNIPLANAAMLYLNSFFLPNLIYTAAILPLFFAAYYMGKWTK